MTEVAMSGKRPNAMILIRRFAVDGLPLPVIHKFRRPTTRDGHIACLEEARHEAVDAAIEANAGYEITSPWGGVEESAPHASRLVRG